MKKESFDDVLLNWFQKISDKTQSNIGLHNFHIAMIFLVFTMAFFTWLCVAGVSLWGKPNLIGIIIMVSYLFEYVSTTNKIMADSKTHAQNPLLRAYSSEELADSRQLALCLLILALMIVVCITFIPFKKEIFEFMNYFKKICAMTLCMTVSYFCAVYFGSCTPKPKQPSKLKQYIESITIRLQLKPA